MLNCRDPATPGTGICLRGGPFPFAPAEMWGRSGPKGIGWWCCGFADASHLSTHPSRVAAACEPGSEKDDSGSGPLQGQNDLRTERHPQHHRNDGD